MVGLDDQPGRGCRAGRAPGPSSRPGQPTSQQCPTNFKASRRGGSPRAAADESAESEPPFSFKI
eukprot:283510-Hanusia_phi.AAC.1